MFFLIYRAHPNVGTEAHSKYAGADIVCWINVNDRDIARAKAQQLIRARDWTIDRLEEEHPITREIAETSEGLQYFDQALLDGEVLVFVTSPVEERRKKR